jgi:hypothetical protein
MMFREIIALYFENSKTHICTLWAKTEDHILREEYIQFFFSLYQEAVSISG